MLYEVVQFSAAFAANEIPTAAAMLAIGRNVRTQAKAASHGIKQHKEMVKAVVTFSPQGEYDLEEKWPKGPQVIFRGYFTGFSYRRAVDKMHVIANLVHWSAALAFSSAMTKLGHVANPAQLNAEAVFQSLGDPGGGLGHVVSSLAPATLIADTVQADVWGALKTVFCAYASVTDSGLRPGSDDASCGGSGTITHNDVALEALARIEGVTSTGIASKAYDKGVPLAMENLSVDDVVNAVTSAIGNETVDSYASVTFWDKLVGQFCPMFGMSFVPLVESAIVVADTPAYNGGLWRTLTTGEYDGIDGAAELHRPLRAIGVLAQYQGDTGAGYNIGEPELPIIGGCFAADSVSPGDGVVLYVQSPPWLTVVLKEPKADQTTGAKSQTPVKTATTPEAQANLTFDAKQVIDSANALYKSYAQTLYVQQMLRGRVGTLAGKLRFDIAPLSTVKIVAASEKLLGGEDDLAAPMFACVQRVTYAINAESGLAGTSFVLSHIRSEAENTSDRTSVSQHPLFGKSIHGGGKHGTSLLEAFRNVDNVLAGDGPVNLTGTVA